MPKISYNTNGLRKLDLIEAINKVKKFGYDGLEMSFHDNHINPLKVSRERLLQVKKTCKDIDIDIVCIATGADKLLSYEPFEPSLINTEKEGRRKRIDLLKKSIAIAKYLEVPVLNFASGKLKEGMDKEKAMEYLCEGIDTLLKEDDKIILAIEPEPNFFVGTSAVAVELIKKINNPRFRLNLDIGHVYCCENDFYGALENSLQYTRHIHIEDIKNKVHYHEIPGEGDINFQKVFEILKKYNYEDYVSVELYNHSEMCDKALKESKEYLTNVINSF
ncbi:sugar phosphate isomerase/epimerase [Clostridium estertheticum]|uniref:sugar phosphate isomerase/epimerase family protein n=1 Tax=Clostridium estertheticum TaxID=238834 RepID=UPI0013EEDFCF|nr:sugar phosphate isomerase/epimerase family protein [Clostridium estertheticum]MBZ9607166.1 sugar phosphate isomerase/epimerase [Clostridium estertheticum]